MCYPQFINLFNILTRKYPLRILCRRVESPPNLVTKQHGFVDTKLCDSPLQLAPVGLGQRPRDLVHEPLVLCEGGVDGEALAADGALEGRLARVQPLVRRQLRLRLDHLAAKAALELRLLVSQHVLLQQALVAASGWVVVD